MKQQPVTIYRAAATLVLAMFGGKAQGQRILVLAGMGNNGAAGLAAVRQLVNLGFNVEPILGGVEEQLMPTARRPIDGSTSPSRVARAAAP